MLMGFIAEILGSFVGTAGAVRSMLPCNGRERAPRSWSSCYGYNEGTWFSAGSVPYRE
jgi:hypothetical protein